MFAYCTERLHLSEDVAYLRIRVARAARGHPELLVMLADGQIHLSGIGKLIPHMTPENRDELLKRATHRSKREIEELLAELQPQPDVPSTMRKLPTRPAPQLGPDPVGPLLQQPDRVRVAPRAAAPARRAEVQSLAPERHKVQFTASAEFREKLERLQALMSASVPGRDLATVLERVVSEKLERLEARRFDKTKKPRKTLAQTNTRAVSRHVPAAVRRTVHARDGGRCCFVDAQGRRCGARKRLEFHHHDAPYGRGWRPPSRQPSADVSDSQRASGRDRIRQGVDGSVPRGRKDRINLSFDERNLPRATPLQFELASPCRPRLPRMGRPNQGGEVPLDIESICNIFLTYGFDGCGVRRAG